MTQNTPASVQDSHASTTPPIRIGVSSCLLGEEVRYDGKHKRDAFVTKVLSQYVEFIPVCPEVSIGLGVPRAPINLHGELEEPRLLSQDQSIDHTDTMNNWSAEYLATLPDDLCGFILKSKSPSCGMFRLPVHHTDGTTTREGRGLFAQALTKALPHLPVEEDGRLNDTPLRENFIQRIFTMHRWHEFLRNDPTPKGLVAFHTCHKYTLLAYNEVVYRDMGRWVAQAGSLPWDELISGYLNMMTQALAKPASRGRHTNVLQHLMGFLKTHLSSDDKEELLDLLDQYREGQVPLIVPLTLLRHHARHNDVPEWVHQQVYLRPYPKELLLQNYI